MKAESSTVKTVILLYTFSSVRIPGLNARTTSVEYTEGGTSLSNDSKSDGKGRSVAHEVTTLCKFDSPGEHAGSPLFSDPSQPVNERVHRFDFATNYASDQQSQLK